MVAGVTSSPSERSARTRPSLTTLSEDAFNGMRREDWLEAFAGHPRIGDLESLRHRFASTGPGGGGGVAAAHLAAGEQAGTRDASDRVLRALAQGNADYERRFGHIFIVCATGKSADEMLAILEQRLSEPSRRRARDRGRRAAQDHAAAPRGAHRRPAMSRITTHVLDLARGRPAAGVAVTLERGAARRRLERARRRR